MKLAMSEISGSNSLAGEGSAMADLRVVMVEKAVLRAAGENLEEEMAEAMGRAEVEVRAGRAMDWEERVATRLTLRENMLESEVRDRSSDSSVAG